MPSSSLRSRHLVGEPYRVAADYYFDVERLSRAFPRTREAAFLSRAFPGADAWPPHPSIPVFHMKLSDGEGLCAEVDEASRRVHVNLYAHPETSRRVPSLPVV